jgi:hypothetical protein
METIYHLSTKILSDERTPLATSGEQMTWHIFVHTLSFTHSFHLQHWTRGRWAEAANGGRWAEAAHLRAGTRWRRQVVEAGGFYGFGLPGSEL